MNKQVIRFKNWISNCWLCDMNKFIIGLRIVHELLAKKIRVDCSDLFGCPRN